MLKFALSLSIIHYISLTIKKDFTLSAQWMGVLYNFIFLSFPIHFKEIISKECFDFILAYFDKNQCEKAIPQKIFLDYVKSEKSLSQTVKNEIQEVFHQLPAYMYACPLPENGNLIGFFEDDSKTFLYKKIKLKFFLKIYI